MNINICNLGDQEILNDSIISQKQLTDSYNVFTAECVNPQLRTAMLDILKDEHNIQADLFKTLQTKGWYQVENATSQQLQKVKNKFSPMN